MKKTTIVLVALALLAAPALAQKRGQPQREVSPEEIDQKRQAAEVDQQYNAALKRMNKDTTATRVDPWSNMRDNSDSSAKR